MKELEKEDIEKLFEQNIKDKLFIFSLFIVPSTTYFKGFIKMWARVLVMLYLS